MTKRTYIREDTRPCGTAVSTRNIYPIGAIDAESFLCEEPTPDPDRADREREKSGEKEERSDDVWSRKFDRALNLISVPGRRLN